MSTSSHFSPTKNFWSWGASGQGRRSSTRCLPPARWPSSDLICPIFSNKWLYLNISRILWIHDQGNSDILLSVQCTKIILPTFDNWREWLILLQSTRMVDSGIFIAKIGWFYPNRESTFWAMHAILAMRNNKMGHRSNKMWTLINKVGHRNVKLVDTYQQLVFKKQQNGSRVLYQLCILLVKPATTEMPIYLVLPEPKVQWTMLVVSELHCGTYWYIELHSGSVSFTLF